MTDPNCRMKKIQARRAGVPSDGLPVEPDTRPADMALREGPTGTEIYFSAPPKEPKDAKP